MSEARDPVVRLDDVSMHFTRHRSLTDILTGRQRSDVKAVDGASLEVRAGEVLAIVGESGCGKTTTANLVMGLLVPTAGSVEVEGRRLSDLSTGEMRKARRRIQMVFQDPYESLNPRMTVQQIVSEPLRVHGVGRGEGEESVLVAQALEFAGLRPADRYLRLRPHELSGGMRQRVVVAAALVLEPAVLIADEPVSMLDVSIRAEVLNLLGRLAREKNIGVMMITHDLSTVAAYADRVAVMYLGRIVEIGPTLEVLESPRHPYSAALLSVVPVPHPDRRRPRTILSGETPDPSRIPTGCRFHPRCPVAETRCTSVDPILIGVGRRHEAACVLVEPA